MDKISEYEKKYFYCVHKNNVYERTQLDYYQKEWNIRKNKLKNKKQQDDDNKHYYNKQDDNNKQYDK